jgi:hypothetical protein
MQIDIFYLRKRIQNEEENEYSEKVIVKIILFSKNINTYEKGLDKVFIFKKL